MTIAQDILLAEADDWINLLIFGAFVVIGVLGAIGKKVQEWKQQRDYQQEQQRRRYGTGAMQQRQAGRQEASPGREAAQRSQATAGQQAATAPQPPQQRPQSPTQQLEPRSRSDALRDLGLSSAAEAVEQVSAQADQQQQAAQMAAARSARRRRRAAVAQEQAGSRQRRTSRRGTIAGPKQRGAAGTSARSYSTTGGQTRGIRLGKLTAAQARKAIVYHEIFSPPKALRHGSEMRDL